MSPWRDELRRLMTLALPVMGAQVGGMLMGTVDTLMLGRVSVDALAGAAIANAWIFSLLLFGQGLVHGIDPLVTQAHGAGRGDQVARTAQQGAVMALVVSVPLCWLGAFTEDALLLLGQAPALAAAAHQYTVVQLPSIPAFMLFVTLRQYLQGREIVRPTLWVTLVANVFNAIANYGLIFGPGPLPALGLVGAGIATAATRFFMLALLIEWVRRFRLHAGAWVPLRASTFRPAAIARLARLGLPVALQMSLEIWAFSTATLIAGRLSSVDLAAHTIVLNMAALAFMAPLGISQGTVTRIGNLLGAGLPADAQRAAWVAFAVGAGVMTLSATAFVLLRNQLPMLYTPDAAVIVAAASILPIAGAFQIFDGIQVVGAGILRGMGRTRPAAVFNLIAYWVIGLPLGGWLALSQGWGLPGLWWGLCLGLATVAACLLVWVRLRGPERAALQLVS
jgi:MATE family multidrug resistance protein